MVRVYVGLQQTDLHCISASEAFRNALHLTDLAQLRRYRLLNIVTDSSDPVGTVERYLSGAFDLVNPNKETVSIETIPDCPVDPERATFGVEVLNQLPSFRSIDVASLRASNDIESISSGLVWVITVRRNGRTDAQLLHDVETQYVVSQSRTAGLLVNPLFETYRIFRL